MVSPFLRKVKTASGAMAVQIAVKEGHRDKVIEHLGSAHTQAELAALMEIGRRRIAPGQLALDLSPVPSAPPPASSGPANVGAVVASKRSALLWDVLHGAYTRLGLGEAVGGDRACEQMVLARLIEPTTCKAQVPRVLADLGLEPVSVRTLFRSPGSLHRARLPPGHQCRGSEARYGCRRRVTVSLRASPRSTSRPRRRTSCARSAIPKREGSTPRSSSSCWSTGPASP